MKLNTDMRKASRGGYTCVPGCYRFLSALEKDLKVRFFMDINHLDNFLYFTLKQLPVWDSCEIVHQTMPSCFKANNPATCIIIDCTVIYRNDFFILCSVTDVLVLQEPQHC